MAMFIVAMECTACGDCEPICPTQSIIPHKGVFKIDERTCTECEGDFDLPKCEEVCTVPGCIIPAPD